MNERLTALIVIVCFLAAGIAFAAEKTEGARNNPDRDKPITITSDRLEAFNDKKMVVFSGNAVAVQGDKTIKANTLLIYYKKDPSETGNSVAKPEAGEFAKTGSVEKIEADGNVKVMQEKKIVTGDHAVYYQDIQKIVMTGNAVMKEENNVIRGDRIDVFLNENRGVVEGSGNKRVTATIYPAGEKQKEKEKEGK